MKIPRDYRQLVGHATKAGWTLDRTRSDHWRLRAPNGAVVVFAASPSCWRSTHNLRADLRRAGLELPR